MEATKEFWQHLLAVYRNEHDPEHTFSYYLQDVASATKVWFTSDAIKTVPKWHIGLFWFLSISVWTTWSLVAVELTQTEINRDTVVQVMGTVSIIMGGSVTSLRIVEQIWKRELFTSLIEKVDVKVKEARALGNQRRNQEANLTYAGLGVYTIGGIMSLFLFAVGIVFFSGLTGQQYFQMAIPIAREPYSGLWWCETIYIGAVVVYCGLIYNIMDSILLDIIFQLAFLTDVQYDILRSLSPKDPNPSRTLVNVYKELVEIRMLLKELLSCLWAYQFMWRSLGTILFAMSCVCLIMELHNGWLAIFAVCFYPTYIIFLLTVWGFIGTYFESSACELNSSMWESNWMDVDPGAKKIMIIMMSFGQTTPQIEIEPFYVVNRESYAQFLQKTYSFVALIRTAYADMF